MENLYESNEVRIDENKEKEKSRPVIDLDIICNWSLEKLKECNRREREK